MTWFADLAPCDYFDDGPQRSRLLAVGWLGYGQPIPSGPVAPEDRAALNGLLAAGWSPYHFLGWHDCDLDGQERSSCGQGADRGTLFVPALEAGVVYAAPTMIGHYIDVHGYSPPPPFLAAVRACPAIPSLPYLERMARHRDDLSWRVGILTALPFEPAPPEDLARLLVDAARHSLLECVDNEVRMRARPHRPRPAWAADLAPSVARAARTLGAAGSLARAALPDLERARAVFTDEPHAAALTAALSRITSI